MLAVLCAVFVCNYVTPVTRLAFIVLDSIVVKSCTFTNVAPVELYLKIHFLLVLQK